MRLTTKQVMLDLETLHTVPGGAILSIGACTFDWERGVDMDDTFYMIVNRASAMSYGNVSPDTLNWWDKQTPEARKVLDQSEKGGYPLPYTLGCLQGWLDKHDNPPVWTNGPGFDEAFLAVAALRCGVPAPVHFRKSRCFRTLKAMYGHEIVEPMMTEGASAHNALDDAVWQAQYAVSIFRYLLSFKGDLK